MIKRDQTIILTVILASVVIALPQMAHAAASTGMPYEAQLTTILNSVSGPVARVAGAIAIIVFGLGLAFSEGGGMVRKGLGILLGLTIAFNAVSWGLTFFGFGGGLLV
ncbi:MAG: TrbC/VirB2 family protein [Gammaproteobacteria bacterium]|nr:TrbC/VirB2 family protein [Gammaproteobacteria bacterium]MCP4388155.1 TrbC/VirB2 family protein [Gammaproteobacteria bacterium]MCP5093114.1 TrbC/VirB2 family protein [Gammaproteobacteria bacterium]